MSSDVQTDVAIRFKDVNKIYHLFKNDRSRFYSLFNKKVKYETIHANCDLSFEVKKGEAVALVGTNGAGKSTALKIITGVITPTSGEVEVNGRVSALLELSAGFDRNLTGRENIQMRGFLWGLDSNEIKELMPVVEDFAELGSYFDQPMRTYSSGMRSRLGFAFASNIDPDILVVDEALSVGDKKFSKKCVTRVKEIMNKSGVTILFVTHNSASAKEMCTRGLVLEKGVLTYDGAIADAIDFYDKSIM